MKTTNLIMRANTAQPMMISTIPAHAQTMMMITRCLSPGDFNSGSSEGLFVVSLFVSYLTPPVPSGIRTRSLGGL